MDVIILFQALMNAIGLTFNATAYAGKSTYTISKEEVDAWWLEHGTSPEYSKYYKGLTDEQKMLLYAAGSNDFDTTMDYLNEYLKEHPEVKYHTADEFMIAYSNALISAQQNSIDYTKDGVTKTAYNITSEILDITKQIAKAVVKPVIAVNVRQQIEKIISDKGYSWKVNWDLFNERFSTFLSDYPQETYRYLYVSAIKPSSSDSPDALGIVIWLSDTLNTATTYTCWGLNPSVWTDQILPMIRDNDGVMGIQSPTFVDVSLLKYQNEAYGLFNDSSDFTLYNKIAIYNTYVLDKLRAYEHIKTFDAETYYSGASFDWTHFNVYDRVGGTSKSYAIVKDVVGVGQTIIGVTNDRADESDDKVLIMNAEGVETLARADADAYPEVLPSTIAAQIVDVGASVADAVSDIATKNPEYPYVPKTPLANTTGNNLFTLYNVTTIELSQLADYLWSTDFIDTFKKFFSDPSDSLISLVAYPVDIKSNGAKNIKIGYTDSGVSSNIITDYIQEFDLGSVFVPKYYNNFLDNNPYTKVSIYLPFIGSCSLDSDIVVGSTIKITYRVELLTGNCVALLTVSNVNGTYPIYQFNGNMGMQFPLSSGSYASIYKNLISTGVSAVAAYVSGGALTPLAIASAANTVVGSKSEVSKSGNVSGSAGYCGIMKPYVLVERPVTDIPGSYATYNGVVTNMSLNVGSLHGYCVMENVDVSTVPCTENERAELTNLLLSGFFI